MSGSWAAARLWARAELRARWRSIAILGLIAGITAGVAIAAVVGSIESGNALARTLRRTNASTDFVFASQVGQPHPDWTTFRHRPEVKDFAVWTLVFGTLDGDPDGLLFVPRGPGWLRTLDRPIVKEGRLFRDDAPDEMIVGDAAARQAHIHVGDTMRFVGVTAAQEAASEGGPPDTSGVRNPAISMHVVGIVRTPIEPLFVGGLEAASPALLTRHPGINYLENAVVQLRHPSTQLTALEGHASTDIASGTPVLHVPTVSRRVTATTDVERLALALLAAAVALAGIVLVGQVVARSATRVTQDVRVLRAVGLRRATIASAATLAHLVAAVTMLVTSVATAWIASRWLPLGEAAQVAPSGGRHLHAVIVLPLAVAAMALFVVGSFGVAWLGVGRAGRLEPERNVGIVEWLRRHAAPSVGIGTTLALRKGRGSSGLPVRPALLGAIVGVLGVAGALTLDAGLHDALSHPERAGVAWDAFVLPTSERGFVPHGLAPAFVRDVTHLDHVRDVAQLDRTVQPVDRGRGVPTFAIRPATGHTSISLVLTHGRAPRPGEVALGPRTLETTHHHLGDTILVGDPPQRLRVVGTALFPNDVHAQFDEGLWLVPQDYDRIAPTKAPDIDRTLVLRVDPGTTDQVLNTARGALARWAPDGGPADVPPELTTLHGVLPLPRLLAAFLAALALAALVHVLVSTTRLRAGEFAVLRALGFTRRATRLVLNVQATTVFVVGLLFGAPLGVAVGRVGWTFIADRVPLSVVPPLALVATLALIPATLLLAQALALGPGRRLGRLRTAEVLRAE
jgi:ABC-type lipoprotein release transport system permease subunit